MEKVYKNNLNLNACDEDVEYEEYRKFNEQSLRDYCEFFEIKYDKENYFC